MSDIRKAGPPLGLQAVSASMTPEQRCVIREENVQLLLDLEWRSNLLLGAELWELKYSGDFTRSKVWSKEDKARGWREYIRRREFESKKENTFLSYQTANELIMWSILYGCFAAENARRAERNQLPLPLPTSVSQLRPYATVMRRVDDWEPPQLDRSHPNDHVGAFDMEPPFAADQPDVIAAWEAAWETIPPDKRIRRIKKIKNGVEYEEPEPVPPTEFVSRQYFREREGLKQIKAREEREIEEARQAALTVGQRPASPERPQAAASPPPRTPRKPPPPRKSEAELEAERRAYQIQQDARDYRLKLMNLQQSAESLRAFLKNTLAREGSEQYLTELRNLDAGIYSVGKDVQLIRDAVLTIQEAFRLATEPYTPPTPIAREEMPADAVIDIDGASDDG